MTGDFLITKEFLKQYNPCAAGYRWFCEHYPDGGKYQEILDTLCDQDRLDDASWLLARIGTTDDVLEIDGINDCNKSIFFAGSVVAKTSVVVRCIKAGGSIKAGWHIEAGENIEAGNDYGIYAGLSIRLSNASEQGYIAAKDRPNNIMCGYWRP